MDQKAAAAKKQEELDNLQKLYADQALAVAQRKNKAAKEAQDAKDDANKGGGHSGAPLSPPRAPTQPDNTRGPFAPGGDGAPAAALMQGDSKDSGFSPQPRVVHTPPRQQHHHQSPQPPLSSQNHHLQQQQPQPHQQPSPGDWQSKGRGAVANDPQGGTSPMQLYQQRHQHEPTQELQSHDLQQQQQLQEQMQQQQMQQQQQQLLQQQQMQQQQQQQQQGGLSDGRGVEYGGQAPREEG